MQQQRNAKLRVGEFLLSSEVITRTINSDKQQIFSKTLSYADLTPYFDFPPGKYTIKVSMQGKTILEQEYGMGENGIYTLCLYAIPKKNMSKNFQTTSDKLHTIFAGDEAKTPNGYMPKIRILNDEFQKGKDEAQIRWLHFAPRIQDIAATYQTKSNMETTQISNTNYPKDVTNKALIKGVYTFEWNLKGSPQKLASTRQAIKSKNYYTFFLLEKLNQNVKSLQVVTGVTPSKFD